MLVSFQNYNDKEDILRRSKLIRGFGEGTTGGKPGVPALGSQLAPGLYITEDTSRRTREQRAELVRFSREIRKRHPEKHCVIRTDRLYVDNDYVYAWSEKNQRIERIHSNLSAASCNTGGGGGGGQDENQRGGVGVGGSNHHQHHASNLRNKYGDSLMALEEDEIQHAKK